MKFPAILLLIGLGLGCMGLAGCGQKGPLYLPSEKPEQGSDSKLVQPQIPADAT
jgi:predicted small lipoprotein YifL